MSKNLTMVSRLGAVVENGKVLPNSIVINLVDNELNFISLKEQKLIEMVESSKDIVFSNVGVKVENGRKVIVSTNGAIEKYPLIDTNKNALVGKACAIVLNRIEKDNILVGYTMMSASGIIKNVTIDQALKIYNSVGIANGKIRNTSTGDIIQSIKGDYSLKIYKTKEVEKAEKEDLATKFKVTLGLMVATEGFVGDKKIEYIGTYIDCDNASVLSEIAKEMFFSNKEITKEAEKLGMKETVIKSFELVRTGTNGFYGVFKLSDIKSVSKKFKVSFEIVTETLPVTVYNIEKQSECVVDLNKKLKLISKDSDGTDDTKLKLFTKKVIDTIAELS